MKKLIRKIYAKWMYRKVPYGICCCGCDMENHGIDYSHSPRDSKEYAITRYSEGKQ